MTDHSDHPDALELVPIDRRKGRVVQQIAVIRRWMKRCLHRLSRWNARKRPDADSGHD